jgi:hypothetical protein
MHTIMVVSGGIVLLALFCLIGRLRNGLPGMARAARLFLPVWFVAAIINLSVGVLSAGYTVVDELPILLVIFGVPAILATLIAWRARNN